MCTAVLIGETPQPPPPPQLGLIFFRGCNWSAKIDPLVISHDTENGNVEKLKRCGGRREGRSEGGRDDK